jgi:hypothetical protein
LRRAREELRIPEQSGHHEKLRAAGTHTYRMSVMQIFSDCDRRKTPEPRELLALLELR